MYDDIGREYERKQYGRYAFKFIRRAATITSIAALRKKIEYGETDLPADGGHFAKAGFDLLNSNTRGFSEKTISTITITLKRHLKILIWHWVKISLMNLLLEVL